MRTVMTMARKLGYATSVVAVTMALIVATSAVGHAAGPWLVAPDGNDANDCLTPPSACATVNGALGKPGFVAGDTVRMAAGTYTGVNPVVVFVNKSVTLAGGWDSSFTVQSGVSILDGQGAR